MSVFLYITSLGQRVKTQNLKPDLTDCFLSGNSHGDTKASLLDCQSYPNYVFSHKTKGHKFTLYASPSL